MVTRYTRASAPTLSKMWSFLIFWVSNRRSIDVFRLKLEIREPKKRESQKHEVWIELLRFNGGGGGGGGDLGFPERRNE